MTRHKLSTTDQERLYHSVIPIANEFRNEFLDSNQPIEDTFGTLERLGYLIVRFPSHGDLSGFHIKKGNYDCIFINSSHSLGRQYFSAWHECYHAYTGDTGGLSLLSDAQYNEMEKKADYFASCVLMPEDLVESYLQRHGLSNLTYISHTKLIQMQNFFRVSYSALITRLIQLYPAYRRDLKKRYSLGSPNRSDEMLEKIEEAHGDPRLAQPTNDFTVSQRFYKKLHDNLQQDRISSEKAISVLEFLESIKQKYES
ncbi:ImmA/IrrE family metallo-endopeptidase [Bacillus thuringiensis]|uniref:ImmA/IrrE family metallo-endopeptidase n=1 Tax=Bacillus thuringiensis TaxID=1428 RepID=UPI000BF96278|nr:ImmA/IrrE family metallo-endopeptidase [Bacillus thuringiensis]PFR42516.1 hypothetical protein COK27_10880 [Bacillus thuringiensis]PGL25987.1 hypothetical protein CN921_11820 [Bacillus thuringiensis]